MKITEQEMRGLLAGKCVPGDMKVNEELSAYLVRKFGALQQRLDALAAENKLLDIAIGAIADAHATGVADLLAQEIHTAVNAATPATEACLNSVRADAVNHAGKMIMVTMNHQDKGVERALECLAEVELQYVLAGQLHAGKDGE